MTDFCEIFFVRHGETEWNRIKRLQGTTDIPLNDLGRTQCQEAAQRLLKGDLQNNTPNLLKRFSEPVPYPETLPWLHAIYSSPLKRASESAQIIAKCLNYPQDKIIVDQGLREWNMGELQGKMLSDLQTVCPQSYKAWLVERDADFDFNGGESFRKRQQRVFETITRIADLNIGKRLLIVGHGGFLDDVYRICLKMPPESVTRVAKLNGEFYIVQVHKSLSGKGWRMVRWGPTIMNNEEDLTPPGKETNNARKPVGLETSKKSEERATFDIEYV